MKKIIFINFFIVLILILSLEIIIRFLNIVGLQGYEKEAFYFENGIIFSKPNNTFKSIANDPESSNNAPRS